MTSRVLVVGATGRTGLHLVRQALARGFEVTALARGPGALQVASQRLSIVRGDVLDPASLSRAALGQDAVLCALGPVKGAPPALCSDGTRHLLQAMEAQRVRRLVCVTGAMIGHRRDRLGWMYRLLLAVMPRAALADRQLQEKLVRGSNVDWTIVRPPRLTDGAARGTWRAGEDIPIGSLAHLSRADLADFMLRELETPAHVRQAVAVAQ
jgi:putative NADH-flavin reductase